jgi:hypothetical protein
VIVPVDEKEGGGCVVIEKMSNDQKWAHSNICFTPYVKGLSLAYLSNIIINMKRALCKEQHGARWLII